MNNKIIKNLEKEVKKANIIKGYINLLKKIKEGCKEDKK